MNNEPDNPLDDLIGLDDFLPLKEMRRRQTLGYKYFQGGRIYRVRKDFRGLSKAEDSWGRKKKIDVERGHYLLCTLCEPTENRIDNDSNIGVVEFIYLDNMLRYVTDGHTLCCMLDLVEFENE